VALTYTVRPISDRTAFARKHIGSPFTVKWHQVLDVLQREYDMLHGRHLVIEVDVPERAIRNDGLLRSDAKSTSPAVRVAFDSKHGPITMATDRFIRQSYRQSSMDDWQHNVYAIAKALEALRMVDRYGVSRSDEQYRGYKAIGSGTGLAPTGMTTSIALSIVKDESGLDDNLNTAPMSVLRNAVRIARAAAHPDRHNGDRVRYDAVDQAVQVLERQGLLT
jgi:hypothetical protein